MAALRKGLVYRSQSGHAKRSMNLFALFLLAQQIAFCDPQIAQISEKQCRVSEKNLCNLWNLWMLCALGCFRIQDKFDARWPPLLS